MNTRQQILTTQFKRVSIFCRENDSAFLPGTAQRGPSMRQQILSELNGVIEKIGETHVVQINGSLFVDSEEKKSLRLELRARMREINRAMKFIAIERNTPAIAIRFRNLTNGSDQMLITRALSICEAIVELKLEDELIEMQQPVDFLSTLRARVEAFKTAEKAQSSARQMKSGATALLDSLIARGKVLVQGLNVIVTHIFKDQPEKLAAWQTACHVERPRRRASGKALPIAPPAHPSATTQAPPPPTNGAPRGLPGLDENGDHAR